MKNTEKLLHIFGESAGAVLALSVATGAVWFSIKYFIIKFLKIVGIDHFAKMKLSYEWIGKTVIESRSVLNADRTCFYRLSNGRAYIESSPIDNRNIKIDAVVNITKNRGIAKLPESLDDRFYEWFQIMDNHPEFSELFVTDPNISDSLRNELQKLDVLSYVAIKIKKGNELYGVVLYTWHHVQHMPKQLLPKFSEHLQYVKSTILDETLFIVSKTLRYRIQNVISTIKNKFRRKQ